jgi:hypothetical protein
VLVLWLVLCLRAWPRQAERHGLADEAGPAPGTRRDVELAVEVPQVLADCRLSHRQAGGDLPDRGCRAGRLPLRHRFAQRGENVDFALG